MKITLNGSATDVDDGWTVVDVVRSLLDGDRGVAVSVDREVIPRSEWATFGLHDGAAVEVLTAAAGG